MNGKQFARFLEKVDGYGSDGCWIWKGSRHPGGHGTFMLDGRRRLGRRPEYAHRVSYEHFVGPIPPDLQIDHLCRTRACVNPAHLDAVTQRENQRRGLKGVLTTHCPHGHPYDEANTITARSGHRRCRACWNAWRRRHRQALREAAA